MKTNSTSFLIVALCLCAFTAQTFKVFTPSSPPSDFISAPIYNIFLDDAPE